MASTVNAVFLVRPVKRVGVLAIVVVVVMVVVVVFNKIVGL